MEAKSEADKISDLYKKLVKSTEYTFPIKGKINVSDEHGVYIIYSPKASVLHVGNTPSGKKGLNQRLYNHISKTGIFYQKYLKPKKISLRGDHKFKFLVVPSPRERALLEALTAGLLCPAHFGTGAKKSIKK
ncbi:MAG: hypothetical protein KF843_15015 [Flavobacteriales bacterium]|nr:hypothetical protein [Flavobacteriales bacterium]